MSERARNYLVDMIFGAVIAALVFALDYSRSYVILRCICDGLFVASVMLLGIGGLKAVRNKGAFDIMGYSMKSTVELFIPMLRRGEKEDIFAYRERKEESRKPADALLLSGVTYLALSGVALILYTIFA